MRILLLGGTSFFGKRLAERLLRSDHSVTLLTRGRTPDPFGDRVERLAADRADEAALAAALRGRSYDLVYDQTCYDAAQARVLLSLLEGRAGRIVFTSSAYVYPEGAALLCEEDFRPEEHRPGPPSYREGKRAAEGVFARQDRVPVLSVRFPIVLGHEDPTGRFRFHIERLLGGRPHYLPDAGSPATHVRADEAARFLDWAGSTFLTGPINAATPPALDAEALLLRMAKALGREPRVVRSGTPEELSPYHRTAPLVLSLARSEAAGFRFETLEGWLEAEVRSAAEDAARGARR